MSLYVVEREPTWGEAYVMPFAERLCGRYALAPLSVPEVRDCNEHDGEWPAYIMLPHETVEHEGRAVPLFEGDVERREWEARRRRR